eukprot:3244584-Rhodomonas_salina.3
MSGKHTEFTHFYYWKVSYTLPSEMRERVWQAREVLREGGKRRSAEGSEERGRAEGGKREREREEEGKKEGREREGRERERERRSSPATEATHTLVAAYTHVSTRIVMDIRVAGSTSTLVLVLLLATYTAHPYRKRPS